MEKEKGFFDLAKHERRRSVSQIRLSNPPLAKSKGRELLCSLGVGVEEFQESE